MGLYLGVTNPLFCIITIFAILLTTTKHTAGFFLLMYGGIIGGTIRSIYPVLPVYGLLLNLIGLYLMRDILKDLFTSSKRSLMYLFLVFSVFGFTYLYAQHTEYASDKMQLLVQNGLMSLCGYYLFDKSDKLKIKDISILLMLTSVCLISYAIVYYNIHPSSIFDFNWFRQGLLYYHYISQTNILVDYQEVGMDSAYALALILCTKTKSHNIYLYVGLAVFLTLVSGARQSLLAVIIVIALRYTFFNEVKSINKSLLLIISCFFLYGAYSMLQSSNIEAVANTLSNGDEERNLIWLNAIKIFMEHPIFGVGLGGFASQTVIENTAWPHNFFLEVLCECGLLGMISLTIIVILFMTRYKVNLKHCTKGGLYYFLPLITLFIRLMVSADFSQSIALFSALFATYGINDLSKSRLR